MANQPLTPEEMKTFNAALEQRILEANQDKTKTKWTKLLPDLMAADVFVVAQVSDRTDAEGGKLLNILMMADKEGHQIIPFFTSPNRMSVLVTPERKTFNVMKLNTVKLFQSIKGKPCVLNPRSPLARVFTPFETNILAMENMDKAAKAAEAKKQKSENQ